MERLDKFLTLNNYVETRTKAQELIKSGVVIVNGKTQTKLSFLVDENSQIEIKTNDVLKYVSRGGLKLEKALVNFKIDVNDKVVMDIGSSTGGFTDCSLKFGAKKVISIDVGTNVMHEKLRQNIKVDLHENTNFLTVEHSLFEGVDLIVVDVSFTSLNRIVEKINSENIKVDMVCLIKPQFECGREIATKYSGVIKSKSVHKSVINNVLNYFNKNNFYLKNIDVSPIKGGDGNIEYISYFSNKTDKNIGFEVEKIVNVAFSNN